MQKQENLNQEKTKKKKSNFRKNLFVTLLFFGTVAVVLVNRYDRKHRSKIHVEVDKNLVQETSQEEEAQNKISIFVYNPSTNETNRRRFYKRNYPKFRLYLRRYEI